MNMQSITVSGTDYPATTFDHFQNETRELAGKLEDRVSKRTGCINSARKFIARKIGHGFVPGTLENIRKGRKKVLDGFYRRQMEKLLVSLIRREIEDLTHELFRYESLSDSSDTSLAKEVAEIEELIAAAKSRIALVGAPD